MPYDPLGETNDLPSILSMRRCKDCRRRTVSRRELARKTVVSCGYCGAKHAVPAWFSFPWILVWNMISLPIGVFAIFYAGLSESVWLGVGVLGLVMLGMMLLLYLVDAYVVPVKLRKHDTLPAHEVPMRDLLNWWRRK